MNKFKLKSPFKPTGDQPQAIDKLTLGLKSGFKHQTMLGVTGSGKTFTMANIIQSVQKPTLVISHNKTLAAQLASEFRDFFPDNAVHYFVSYYDYYQPEAYKPSTDTYIEKESEINEEIERLRHASTNALLSRKDVIIVASVSCIYGLGSPATYEEMSVKLKVGETRKRDKLLRHLTDLQFSRNDQGFYRGDFRVKGDVVEIFPMEEKNEIVRIEFYGDKIEKISKVDFLTGKRITIDERRKTSYVPPILSYEIFPARHFVTPEEKLKKGVADIRQELAERIQYFKSQNLLLEAQRIEQRTNYDLEMIEEVGYCNGIENYSRYLTGREAGEQPATLIDYFPDDFLMFIDESHMTIPQLNGMYNGDRARKQTLVDFGFRLPSALANRPLKFSEFEKHINKVIYVSATPAAYEYRMSKVECRQMRVGNLIKEVVDMEDLKSKIKAPDSAVAQQVIRPTGLLEPSVEIKKTKNQLDDLLLEIKKTVKKKQRVLVTTLTKRLAEEISDYLKELKIKVQYLHSEIDTLERLDILRDLRLGKFDVLVGINLLREGLDLPEVSLVAILDADKEGFLRSETSLIQTMGRAARHSEGRVIMYADKLTGSMKRAIEEVERRRRIQRDYNKQHHLTPRSIEKEVGESLKFRVGDLRLKIKDKGFPSKAALSWRHAMDQPLAGRIDEKNYDNIPKDELKRIIDDLEDEMKVAAGNLEFEKATELRDEIKRLKSNKRL
ncbi:MAG TPA: excinuclease ABC subunit UvrB [Patescibacteria group bacterium]|nr:excinuclease ABC subunit UvrB [Patescibacteria group bacterium]